MRRALLPLLLLLPACGPAPLTPAGSYSDVALVIDAGQAGVASPLADALSAAQDYVVTVEPRFNVSVFDAARAGAASVFKNAVVCGVLENETEIGRVIAETIGPSAAKRVAAGELNVIRRENHPVAGRVVLVVTAASEAVLREVLARRAGEVADSLDASCRARMLANLMREARGTQSAAWERAHGFHLAVPAVYEPVPAPAGAGGVELRREGPPRVLGVFWRDAPADTGAVAPDSLFAWRAAHVAARYDGDRMDRARAWFDAAPPGTGASWRMRGHWYNDRRAPAGGYFETYFYLDGTRRRWWAVDLVVYAPGREKTTLVRELRALAESFRAP